MVKKTKPIVFRAYADNKERYWAEVRVFDTHADMLRDIKKEVGVADPDAESEVREATFRRKGRKLGTFAVLWTHREAMTKWPTEVVAHESVHLALRYFDRRGWAPCLAHETHHDAPDVHERRLEERLAYATGRIAKYIARGLFRHGVWKNS